MYIDFSLSAAIISPPCSIKVDDKVLALEKKEKNLENRLLFVFAFLRLFFFFFNMGIHYEQHIFFLYKRTLGPIQKYKYKTNRL